MSSSDHPPTAFLAEIRPAKTYCTKPGGLQRPALPGDVGHNLPHFEPMVIPAASFAQVKTGIHVQFPPNTWGLILPRSSANLGGRLIVMSGVIDQGYTGELTALVHNVAHPTFADRLNNLLNWVTKGWFGYTGSVNDVRIESGKALSQLVFLQTFVPQVVDVARAGDFDAPTHRGTNGWGSTDKNGAAHG